MQEEEERACTFHPAISVYKFDLSRPVSPRPGSSKGRPPAAISGALSAAATGEPGGVADAAAGAAFEAAPCPGAEAAPLPAAAGPAPTGSKGSQPAQPHSYARTASSKAAQDPAFDTYLDRVLFELQELQTADGAPAVWALGGRSTGAGEEEGGTVMGIPAD